MTPLDLTQEKLETAARALQDIADCRGCSSAQTSLATLALQSIAEIDATAASPQWQGHGWDDQHQAHPRIDWRYEVANGDTLLGYHEWVQHRLDAEMT